MIINVETKEIQTNSQFPNSNWMGEGWFLVPRRLIQAAMDYAPYCDLEFDEDDKGNVYLVDITDNGQRPEPSINEQRRIAFGTWRYEYNDPTKPPLILIREIPSTVDEANAEATFALNEGREKEFHNFQIVIGSAKQHIRGVIK